MLAGDGRFVYGPEKNRFVENAPGRAGFSAVLQSSMFDANTY